MSYPTNRMPSNTVSSGSRALSFQRRLKATPVTLNGSAFYEVSGYASVFNTPYEMFSTSGPYMEQVDSHAFDASLASNPDVSFQVNHSGLTMARTTNGSLKLSVDSTGLRVAAVLNADRQDVADLVQAIADGDVDEMSFSFVLEQGEWNDDLTQFTIMKADLNRADVSAVNQAANPFTNIGLGSDDYGSLGDWLTGDVPSSAGAAKSAPAPVPSVGRSVASWRSQLADGELVASPDYTVGYEGSLGRFRLLEVEASNDYADLTEQIRSRGGSPTDAEGYRLEELRCRAEHCASVQARILALAETL